MLHLRRHNNSNLIGGHIRAAEECLQDPYKVPLERLIQIKEILEKDAISEIPNSEMKEDINTLLNKLYPIISEKEMEQEEKERKEREERLRKEQELKQKKWGNTLDYYLGILEDFQNLDGNTAQKCLNDLTALRETFDENTPDDIVRDTESILSIVSDVLSQMSFRQRVNERIENIHQTYEFKYTDKNGETHSFEEFKPKEEEYYKDISYVTQFLIIINKLTPSSRLQMLKFNKNLIQVDLDEVKNAEYSKEIQYRYECLKNNLEGMLSMMESNIKSAEK